MVATQVQILMDNNFSYTELRLVQALLTKKSSADIASIVERETAEVSALIQQICKQRNLLSFDDVQHQKEKAKRWAELQKINKRQEKAVVLTQKIKPAPSRYATRKVDLSQLVSLRIDHKTIIYISPDQDPISAKANYLRKLDESRNYSIATKKTDIEVKKFKPLK